MRLLSLAIISLAFMLTSCANRESANEASDAPAAERISPKTDSRSCVNINTATAEQLIELPGVGEVMSRRIIEYRERNGPFRRSQEVIIIEGFSEKKYRALAELICVE